jgi:Flp pilus assembly protein CpaB
VDAPPDGYTEPTGLTGRVVRRDIRRGEALRTSDFSSGISARGDDVLRALKPGLRAMAIQVDQVTGVGTLIQPGDRVDIVLSLRATTLWPGKEPGEPPTEVPGGPQLTVKLLVQNAEVLGTLVQVPEQQAVGQQAEDPADVVPESNAAPAGVTMTGQQEIVIVALTAQQTEIVRYSQVQAAGSPELGISLVLRATADRDAPPDQTTGITMKELVEKYGVLPPLPMGTEPEQ